MRAAGVFSRAVVLAEHDVLAPVVAFLLPVVTDVGKGFVMRQVCCCVVTDEEARFGREFVLLDVANVGGNFENDRNILILIEILTVKVFYGGCDLNTM